MTQPEQIKSRILTDYYNDEIDAVTATYLLKQLDQTQNYQPEPD